MSYKEYTGKTIRVIDFVEEFNLDFARGNAVKSIVRSQAFGTSLAREIEEVEHAIWYLNDKLAKLFVIRSKLGQEGSDLEALKREEELKLALFAAGLPGNKNRSRISSQDQGMIP